MSEKNNGVAITKIEDEINKLFDGELKETALEFVAYLNANQLTPRLCSPTYWYIPFNECNLCLIFLKPNELGFSFFLGDYIGEFDENFTATVQKHVKICTPCHDCIYGKEATIFGKEYTNVCSQGTIEFINPNFEYIKILIECSKKIAPHSKSWHAHNLH